MLPAHLHPKTWPTWIGVGLVRLIVLLPYSVLMRLGARLGKLVWFFLPAKRRHVLHANIALCFPELSPVERSALEQAHIASMGKGMMEAAIVWWTPPEKVEPFLHFHGLEHIHAALERGKGVLLVLAHFTSTEMGGAIALRVPLNVMYRKSNNAAINYLMRKYRGKHLASMIEKNAIKEVVRRLQKNQVVWYLPDQSPGKHAIQAPFFGIDTATNKATARLAHLTGAAVVPYLALRRKDGTGYDLTVYPALDNFPSGDDYTDASRINALIEGWVRQQPEDYFWFHRRFKSGADGKTDVYRLD